MKADAATPTNKILNSTASIKAHTATVTAHIISLEHIEEEPGTQKNDKAISAIVT